MKAYKVTFSYVVNVEAENESEAFDNAVERIRDESPLPDEMATDIIESDD